MRKAIRGRGAEASREKHVIGRIHAIVGIWGWGEIKEATDGEKVLGCKEKSKEGTGWWTKERNKHTESLFHARRHKGRRRGRRRQ